MSNLAIHDPELISLLQAMDEPVHDSTGRYTGLTYTRLAELLEELHRHRTGEARRILADALTARSEELAVLQVRVEGLRRWLNDNTKMQLGKDQDPIGPTIKMLSDVKTFIQSCWPVLQTMWGNAVHVLWQAGLV